jgi:hypothetical protein
VRRYTPSNPNQRRKPMKGTKIKPMKRVIEGYVYMDEDFHISEMFHGNDFSALANNERTAFSISCNLYHEKGNAETILPEYWPPKEVKITIEIKEDTSHDALLPSKMP